MVEGGKLFEGEKVFFGNFHGAFVALRQRIHICTSGSDFNCIIIFLKEINII